MEKIKDKIKVTIIMMEKIIKIEEKIIMMVNDKTVYKRQKLK